MTKKARKLTRKGWTFRFARTEKDKNKAVELFRTVDGIAGNAVFDGDILVAESPHHSIAGATHAAARGIEVFGGCSAANEGFYRAAGCEIRTDLGNGMVSSNPLYNRWFVLP